MAWMWKPSARSRAASCPETVSHGQVSASISTPGKWKQCAPRGATLLSATRCRAHVADGGLCPQTPRPVAVRGPAPARGAARRTGDGPATGGVGSRGAMPTASSSPPARHQAVTGLHPPKPAGSVLPASSVCWGAGVPGLWKNHSSLCLCLEASSPRVSFPVFYKDPPSPRMISSQSSS